MLILGEAPGADEERKGKPFVGAAGKLLTDNLLPAAGLTIEHFHVLNTFTKRPPENNLKLWTRTKTELKKAGIDWQRCGPPLAKRYLHPEHHWQLAELSSRVSLLKPDLIICLGATALWAITSEGSIGNARGNIFPTQWGSGIATYHPAALLRQWSNLPLTWADLTKASLWIEGTLPKPLSRRLWINPTFAEIANVYALFARNPSWTLGVDIETAPATGQITTISFATPHEGICIPIWDRHAAADACCYWPTDAEEVKAWRWIARFCELPNPKVLQNGLYDMQYMLDAPLELRMRNVADDTAILQHALQPELPKALGTLASLYLNEPSWKQMRASAKDAKADD